MRRITKNVIEKTICFISITVFSLFFSFTSYATTCTSANNYWGNGGNINCSDGTAGSYSMDSYGTTRYEWNDGMKSTLSPNYWGNGGSINSSDGTSGSYSFNYWGNGGSMDLDDGVSGSYSTDSYGTTRYKLNDGTTATSSSNYFGDSSTIEITSPQLLPEIPYSTVPIRATQNFEPVEVLSPVEIDDYHETGVINIGNNVNGYCDFGEKCVNGSFNYIGFYNQKMDEYYYSIYGGQVGDNFTWLTQCIEDEKQRGVYSDYGTRMQICNERKTDAYNDAAFRACLSTKLICSEEYRKESLQKLYDFNKEYDCGDNAYLGDDNYCYCNSGYVYNDQSSMCVSISEVCNHKYGHSYLEYLDDDGGVYVCKCKDGFVLNENGTSCVGLTEACQSIYGPNVYSSSSLDEKEGYVCLCNSGYDWDSTKSECVKIPNNAHFFDKIKEWVCDVGYVRDGDSCKYNPLEYDFLKWIIFYITY